MREIRIDATATTDVVSVQQVKDWGKLKGSTEDDIIDQLIKSCRELQEQWVGRSFIQKTLTGQWDQITEAVIELPFGPVKSVTSVKRVYEDGTLSDALTVNTDYYLSGLALYKKINLYTRYHSAGQIVTGLQIEYVTGHGTAAGETPIPETIKETIMRHVLTDYAMRDDLEVPVPVLYDWTKEALTPYRIDNLWL